MNQIIVQCQDGILQYIFSVAGLAVAIFFGYLGYRGIRKQIDASKDPHYAALLYQMYNVFYSNTMLLRRHIVANIPFNNFTQYDDFKAYSKNNPTHVVHLDALLTFFEMLSINFTDGLETREKTTQKNGITANESKKTASESPQTEHKKYKKETKKHKEVKELFSFYALGYWKHCESYINWINEEENTDYYYSNYKALVTSIINNINIMTDDETYKTFLSEESQCHLVLKEQRSYK